MGLNLRVLQQLKIIETASADLKAVLEDLSSRESDPAFIQASNLFKEGYRLRGWGLVLTDTENETTLSKEGACVGYWADGAGRNTQEALGLLGLDTSDFGYQVVDHLDNLTEEAETED